MADIDDSHAGARMTRVELSIGSLDLLRCVRYDHDFPRHSHAQFTVGVFEVGSGTVRYRHAGWRATDGAILAVPPDEVHQAEPLADSGWTYRTLYPSVELVALAVGASANSLQAFFPQPIFHDHELSSETLRVHRALLSDPIDLPIEEAMLGLLRRLVIRHSAGTIPGGTRSSARAVSVARDYIEAHYSLPVRIADLATVCNTSPFHLIRSFRDAVGMPPHAYLMQVRSNRARDLLQQGKSAAASAYLCGFCDQSQFTRTFKRLFGVTPGAYADAVRSGRGKTTSRRTISSARI
jgi:AraC-like DNA-binding protein